MPSGDSIRRLLERGHLARMQAGRLRSIKPETDMKQTPIGLLVILAVAVFAIELSLMLAFAWLPPLPAWLENSLDATLLTALLFPLLYYLVFRPLTMLNTQQALIQLKLMQRMDELQRFHEVTIGRELRMKELVEENQALKAQIGEAGK